MSPQFLQLGREVQEFCCRMARNDPTMTEVVLFCECSAADGAAAVALLQMQQGRVRCVDCVCATEPPCSSGNGVTEAGAEAIARALEKNTTLQSLNLLGEFVVLCCVVLWLWRVVDWCLCCCGLLLVCVLDGGACALC